MSLGELIRNRLFFLIDKIMKKGIYNNVLDVEKKLDKGFASSDLKSILIHAKSTVPFYEGNPDLNELTDFPIINKSIVRENVDRFIPKNKKKSDLIKVSTSGSSGTPMAFYRTSDKRIRQIAEVIYLSQSANYYFGMKHGFIRATHPKGKLSLLIQNEIHIDPTMLSDNNLEKIRNDIKKMKIIIGFPSTLYEIALYCLKMGDTPQDFKLKGIISTAEPLLEKQKAVIQSLFDCPIQVRYATEELGLVAVQNPEEDYFTINEASFFVEILKIDSDEHCEENEEGRIVVTDFFSYGMPLIRYETGDIGRFVKKMINGKERKVITSISGREIEMIYTPKGEKISPFSINVMMKDVTGVIKFQFIQKDKDNYVMNVVPDFKSYNEIEIKEIIHSILGSDAKVKIQQVESIPTLPSGKTAYIVNEYKI